VKVILRGKYGETTLCFNQKTLITKGLTGFKVLVKGGGNNEYPAKIF
jgi:hypothetical protein